MANSMVFFFLFFHFPLENNALITDTIAGMQMTLNICWFLMREKYTE